MGKRYVRFMSLEELRKYVRGEPLENHTHWGCGSVGFCFFDTSVEPEKRMDYLTGVVDMQVVVEFERVAGPRMRKAYGAYRDPEKDDDLSTGYTAHHRVQYGDVQHGNHVDPERWSC